MKIIITENQHEFLKKKELIYNHMVDFLSNYDWFKELQINVRTLSEKEARNYGAQPGSQLLEFTIFADYSELEWDNNQISKFIRSEGDEGEEIYDEIDFLMRMYFHRTEDERPYILWSMEIEIL